jgi:hypothetical protein
MSGSRRCLRVFGAVIACLFAGRSASAVSVTTYTDAGAFTNGLEDFWSNSFSGITANGVQSNPVVFSGSTSGTYAYSATATAGLYGWAPGTPGPALTTLARNENLVFAGFSPSISAFGGRFWVADFENGSLISGGVVTLTLGLSNNTTASATTTVSSTATFLGLIVDPAVTITSATLSRPGNTNYTTAAGLVIVGAAVPEPATLPLALIAVGAAGVGWRRCSTRGAGRDAG